MTTKELTELFEKHEDEFLKFYRVSNPTSRRSDLHAFMLLDSLVPSIIDIISAAEHDEIFLETSLDDLAPVISESQVIDLVRCGVRLSGSYTSLAMFV